MEISPPHEENEITINIGAHQTVTIDKLYGPWSVWAIRVRADFESADWVIEQEYCVTDENGNDSERRWAERARFTTWPPEVRNVNNV